MRRRGATRSGEGAAGPRDTLMDRLEDVMYPLLWMVLIFAAGLYYRPVMPVCILAIVLLAVYVITLITRPQRC